MPVALPNIWVRRWNNKLLHYYEIVTWAFIAIACAYRLGLRVYFAANLPLWLDESWTAVLSSAPNIQSFTHQMWLDSNAPLYYFLIWLWPLEGDLGLRIPSLIFLLATASAIISWAPLSLWRRLVLAALVMLWPDASSPFFDARYYALLLLITSLQTIAFVRLVEKPTLRRAVLWSTASTMAILTHYYAAIPALFEGLAYLWLHRRRALTTWPAATLILPAIGWLCFHWPRLQLYGQVGTSWYPILSARLALEFSTYAWGSGLVGALGLSATILFSDRTKISQPIVAIFLSGAISGLLMLAAGCLLPVFSPRYLLPIVPPLLFCTVAVIRPAAVLPVAALVFIPGCAIAAWSAMLQERANFGLERAAARVERNRSVTWWIDYAGARIHDKTQMEEMLKDAFQRAHIPLQQARWGTDFQSGDAAIIIHQQASRKVGRPSGWRCNELSGWGHSAVVCLKPEVSMQVSDSGR